MNLKLSGSAICAAVPSYQIPECTERFLPVTCCIRSHCYPPTPLSVFFFCSRRPLVSYSPWRIFNTKRAVKEFDEPSGCSSLKQLWLFTVNSTSHPLKCKKILRITFEPHATEDRSRISGVSSIKEVEHCLPKYMYRFVRQSLLDRWAILLSSCKVQKLEVPSEPHAPFTRRDFASIDTQPAHCLFYGYLFTSCSY